MGCRRVASSLIAIFCSLAVPASADIPISERDALVALYTSTTGAAWYLKTGWLGAAGTECAWYGVTCDAGGATVTAIDLEDNNLAGPIPSLIDSLPNLEFLNLRGNNLSGTLPNSLGNLPSLLELDLGYGGGSIIGSIPTTLGNLAILERLDLSGQSLSGPIPTSITGLSNLVLLNLAYNQLSGGIPASITDLASIQTLVLAGNPLGGSIPAGLGTLTSLTTLNLGWLGLVGEIPSTLGSLPQLVNLLLNWNALTGEIPPELGSLSNLLVLGLTSNQLSGEIPSELGGLAGLGSLSLARNQLSGTIPPALGSLSSLWFLSLEDNSLAGPIPPELGALTALSTLDLGSNQLSGEIPATFGGLSNIYTLSLRHNQLSGTIPAALGSLASLRFLFLSDNALEGPLPAGLGNLANLRRLEIAGNKLAGEIPASFAGLTSLYDDSSDLRWNALSTDDPALAAFLDLKQLGGAWQDTQTVAPGVVFRSTYPGAVWLELTPIAFTGGVGGYDVELATLPGGPFSPAGRLAGKAGGDIWLFFPDTLSDYYWHRARAWTGPHPDNRNTVVSDWGAEQNFFISNQQFVLYVDPAGIAGNDCLTPATACPDIGSVFQLPYTGIRVFVAPGTYNENLTVTRQVELVGVDPANTIIDGGGLDRVIFHNWGGLSLRNLTIRNGATVEDGGGIIVYDVAALSMENCVVQNNTADVGGGIHVAAGATADLKDVVVRLNTSTGEGGGIASFGGLWLNGCAIDDNEVVGSSGGGGISASQSGFLWMSKTAVTDNTTLGSGGGLSNRGVAHIETSLFTGNDANGGPAILNSSSPANMTLVNSTISGNTAQGYNSSTAFYATQPIAMDSCTVTGNTGVGPEAAAIFGGNMTVRSSIIAGNPPVNCSEPLLSYGSNIEDTDSCGLDTAGDQVGVDPHLGALADNGGPTLTHALLEGSPAIDAGHPYFYPATDQRGVARPDGGASDPSARSDTGAFEVDSVIFADGFESGNTSAWSF